MTFDPPIARVVTLLERSGYAPLDQPITVAGIPFEFVAMLIGETSLDLIVVVDTVEDVDASRVRERVEGLSRALDLARSRRPLTVVLVGPPPGIALTHALARVCRVLIAGTPTGAGAVEELENALAVLLPLELSKERDAAPAPDSWAGAREALLAAHPDGNTLAIFESSALGAEAVRETLRDILSAPFGREEP